MSHTSKCEPDTDESDHCLTAGGTAKSIADDSPSLARRPAGTRAASESTMHPLLRALAFLAGVV